MPAPNPYNGEEVLLAIINDQDGTDVLITDVTFGTPQRVEVVLPEVAIRNTMVKITPRVESGLYGIKTFWYNRIHKSELGVITVDRGSATTYVQILPAINDKYGLYMSEDDIIDAALPSLMVGEIVVDLPINPGSLAFYDGDVIATQG